MGCARCRLLLAHGERMAKVKKRPSPADLLAAAPCTRTRKLERFFAQCPEAETHFWGTMLPYQDLGLSFRPLWRMWLEVWPEAPVVRDQQVKAMVDERIASER